MSVFFPMSTPWKMDHRTQYANIIRRNGKLLHFLFFFPIEHLIPFLKLSLMWRMHHQMEEFRDGRWCRTYESFIFPSNKFLNDVVKDRKINFHIIRDFFNLKLPRADVIKTTPSPCYFRCDSIPFNLLS